MRTFLLIALTLGLNHTTSDAYVPIPCNVELSVTRVGSPTIFGFQGGARPHERWDLPFGPGWTSSICANVEISESYERSSQMMEQYPDAQPYEYWEMVSRTATAVDDSGSSQQFTVEDGAWRTLEAGGPRSLGNRPSHIG